MDGAHTEKKFSFLPKRLFSKSQQGPAWADLLRECESAFKREFADIPDDYLSGGGRRIESTLGPPNTESDDILQGARDVIIAKHGHSSGLDALQRVRNRVGQRTPCRLSTRGEPISQRATDVGHDGQVDHQDDRRSSTPDSIQEEEMEEMVKSVMETRTSGKEIHGRYRHECECDHDCSDH